MRGITGPGTGPYTIKTADGSEHTISNAEIALWLKGEDSMEVVMVDYPTVMAYLIDLRGSLYSELERTTEQVRQSESMVLVQVRGGRMQVHTDTDKAPTDKLVEAYARVGVSANRARMAELRAGLKRLEDTIALIDRVWEAARSINANMRKGL